MTVGLDVCLVNGDFLLDRVDQAREESYGFHQDTVAIFQEGLQGWK